MKKSFEAEERSGTFKFKIAWTLMLCQVFGRRGSKFLFLAKLSKYNLIVLLFQWRLGSPTLLIVFGAVKKEGRVGKAEGRE